MLRNSNFNSNLVSNCCAYIIRTSFHPVNADNRVKSYVICHRRYEYYAEIRDVHFHLVDSSWFDTMTDAMYWLANQPESYNGFTSIELWEDRSDYMCTLWCQSGMSEPTMCDALFSCVWTDMHPDYGTLDVYRPELKVGDTYLYDDCVYEGKVTKLYHSCAAIERAYCELNNQVCPF